MSKKNTLDAETIALSNIHGEQNPFLVFIGAIEAAKLRSHKIILNLEARALQAKKNRTRRLEEIARLEKLIHSSSKYVFLPEEEKFKPHLLRIMNHLSFQYSKKFPELKKKYSQESPEELRWMFIKRQILLSAQYEQTKRWTHDDSDDVSLKVAIMTGSKKAQSKSKKKEGK